MLGRTPSLLDLLCLRGAGFASSELLSADARLLILTCSEGLMFLNLSSCLTVKGSTSSLPITLFSLTRVKLSSEEEASLVNIALSAAFGLVVFLAACFLDGFDARCRLRVVVDGRLVFEAGLVTFDSSFEK